MPRGFRRRSENPREGLWVIVVSNSSPLIALAKVGLLNLLKELFGEVQVPRAVWIEVVLRYDNAPHHRDLPLKPLVLKARKGP